jgi:CysZ protein
MVSAGRRAFGVVTGASYPFRALALLSRTRHLHQYVLVPILVNLIVGCTLYAGLLYAGFEGIDAAIAHLPHWAAFLDLVLRIVLGIGLFMGTGFVMLQFGVVLGAPWYGKLSEQLELLRTGSAPPEAAAGVGGAFQEIWRALQYELKKLGLLVVIGLPLVLLNFIPGVGTAIATIGGIALTTLLVCLDCLDAALERRRLRFRDKLRVIFTSFPASGTFGLVCLGIISVPFLNLLAIPVAISAGTMFFCDHILPNANGLRK